MKYKASKILKNRMNYPCPYNDFQCKKLDTSDMSCIPCVECEYYKPNRGRIISLCIGDKSIDIPSELFTSEALELLKMISKRDEELCSEIDIILQMRLNKIEGKQL